MFNPNQKRLLALDGGGIMGVISLCILKRIEDQLRPLSGMGDQFRLCYFFDYIGGTSTGAIIAAGLAVGKSVDELIEFYQSSGALMFQRASFYRRFRYHSFSADPLKRMLHEVIGDETLLQMNASGKLKTLLLVVTRNVTTDSAWPISSNPAARYNDERRGDCNLKIPLWQLVRASTAAPTFFEPEQIALKPGDPELTFVFEDGGVTPYNNPALLLYRMATRSEYGLGWPRGEENLMLVSVGTGSAAQPLRKARRSGKSLLGNARAIPRTLMSSISIENDINCRVIGRCVYGAPINREIGDLIPAPEQRTNRRFLYARYDPNISRGGLDKMGFGDIYAGALQMDNVQMIPALMRIGNKAADVVDLRNQFPAFLRQDPRGG